MCKTKLGKSVVTNILKKNIVYQNITYICDISTDHLLLVGRETPMLVYFSCFCKCRIKDANRQDNKGHRGGKERIAFRTKKSIQHITITRSESMVSNYVGTRAFFM